MASNGKLPRARQFQFKKARPRLSLHEAKLERGRFYASGRWRRLRALKLATDPLCQECLLKGKLEPADTVHHIHERLQRPDLALEIENLLSVCASCHSIHHKKVRPTGRRTRE